MMQAVDEMSDQPKARRYDPDRRQRIIDATVDVIAEVGVAGTTHRKIAMRAGVPLGSLTYHFTGLDELLHAAFERVAELGFRDTLDRLSVANGQDEAIEAVTDVIAGNLWSSPRMLLLSYELYLYAARHPDTTAIMRAWMEQSRTALGRHFDPLTARVIDALIEGIGIHNSVDPEPLDRRQIQRVLRQLLPRAM